MVGISSLHRDTFNPAAQNSNLAKRFSPQAHAKMHSDSRERLLRNVKAQRKVDRSLDRFSIQRECGSPMSSSRESSFSNLNQFLECTTPSVPFQYLPKTCIWDQRWKGPEAESIPFFTLGDLWDSFDEWSAYGAGVPLVLKGDESVVQYYVPYLSALQIYIRNETKCKLNCRKLGEESDASDNDVRDTISEASSDGEVDGVSMAGSLERCRNCQERSAESAFRCTGKKMSLSGCWCGVRVHGMIHHSIDEQGIREGTGRPGHLCFEYFERAAPYTRVPLVDKILELSSDFPQLRTLHSAELSPESWLSIAWYPIYRIPTGPTLRDLATCFLTFHSLSTFPRDGESGVCCFSQNERRVSSNVLIDKKQVKASLQSFGLASYKLRGAFWTCARSSDHQMAVGLQDCAAFWLKQRRVQHPDFEFFLSNMGSGWQ